MQDALTASIIDALLGLKLGAAGQEAGNRFTIEGVTFGAQADGPLEIGIARLEAASLRLVSGPFTLEIGSVSLRQLTGEVRMEAGRPRLLALDAATAEFSAVKVHGPVLVSRESKPASATAPASAWSLAPLAAADGRIRAEIVDAQLLFDADVTVPIRQGRVDFKEATVAHVGPDSRMGVSRLGLYVDAPNGRSYLYQFSSAPVAGVEYERRGIMPGPFGVSHRGSLRLQEFGESLLRQGPAGPGSGFTDQSRLLFDRTAISGDLQLGDGRFAAPGVQADLTGRAGGRNAIRLHSEAVGRGLAVDMASLSVRQALWSTGPMQLGCDEVTGAFTLRVSVDGKQLRFAFNVASMKMAGLRLRPASA